MTLPEFLVEQHTRGEDPKYLAFVYKADSSIKDDFTELHRVITEELPYFKTRTVRGNHPLIVYVVKTEDMMRRLQFQPDLVNVVSQHQAKERYKIWTDEDWIDTESRAAVYTDVTKIFLCMQEQITRYELEAKKLRDEKEKLAEFVGCK